MWFVCWFFWLILEMQIWTHIMRGLGWFGFEQDCEFLKKEFLIFLLLQLTNSKSVNRKPKQSTFDWKTFQFVLFQKSSFSACSNSLFYQSFSLSFQNLNFFAIVNRQYWIHEIKRDLTPAFLSELNPLMKRLSENPLELTNIAEPWIKRESATCAVWNWLFLPERHFRERKSAFCRRSKFSLNQE
jgi:hypothetical protein